MFKRVCVIIGVMLILAGCVLNKGNGIEFYKTCLIPNDSNKVRLFHLRAQSSGKNVPVTTCVRKNTRFMLGGIKEFQILEGNIAKRLTVPDDGGDSKKIESKKTNKKITTYSVEIQLSEKESKRYMTWYQENELDSVAVVLNEKIVSMGFIKPSLENKLLIFLGSSREVVEKVVSKLE